VTNLTDLVPWGLWITIDLSSIALAAGAFTLSAAVYLLGQKQLEPVARTAVWIGLIGYTMAVTTLLLDIGRPDRFWHAVAFWNIHSPLWEVTMCVCFYLTVLMLEAMPIIGGSEWLQGRWPRIAERLQSIHKLAPFLAIAGLGLSMLHQSSLGATYAVLKARPIWYRPGLAVLFIVSAIVAGPALTVLASKVTARITPRAVIDEARLDVVSRFIGWALVGYLYLRFWDVLAMTYTYEPARTEGLSLLTQGPLAFNFWVGEILLGIVVPMIILLSGRLRRQPRLHMLALLLVVGGLVAYRWNINLVGQLVVFGAAPQLLDPQYTNYIPSTIEFLVGAGVVAYGLLAYTIGVRYLRVVDHRLVHHHEEASEAPVAIPGSAAAQG
ncbi:MAG: NrfD/PsrC family molybdoenzyme membrane anchor subunit, partial [Candidatus Promineifilaceae bacterium]|nr:NrfD/PsrC family molybdoenzyme membrane anchor subunit [Candidatus Promineifilaceae bacterium]